MKTNTFLAKTTKLNLPARRYRIACAVRLLPLLLLLVLPPRCKPRITVIQSILTTRSPLRDIGFPQSVR